jgi:hypothetical protein
MPSTKRRPAPDEQAPLPLGPCHRSYSAHRTGGHPLWAASRHWAASRPSRHSRRPTAVDSWAAWPAFPRQGDAPPRWPARGLRGRRPPRRGQPPPCPRSAHRRDLRRPAAARTSCTRPAAHGLIRLHVRRRAPARRGRRPPPPGLPPAQGQMEPPDLEKSRPEVNRRWTDSDSAHDERGLRHPAARSAGLWSAKDSSSRPAVRWPAPLRAAAQASTPASGPGIRARCRNMCCSAAGSAGPGAAGGPGLDRFRGQATESDRDGPPPPRPGHPPYHEATGASP